MSLLRTRELFCPCLTIFFYIEKNIQMEYHLDFLEKKHQILEYPLKLIVDLFCKVPSTTSKIYKIGNIDHGVLH